MLTITEIALYKFSIPLKEPFVTSLGTDVSADNVVVRISTDAGITGFGECSPYMPINGESQDTCFIVGQYFARALKGKNPLEIEAAIRLMDDIIYGNTCIKSAFDMALYDIASRHAGVPLYHFLGGSRNKTIVTDYTVSLGEPAAMAAEAVRIAQQGFPAIKVKLGKNGTTDVERIKAIRSAVGMDIPVRIDANQGWSVPEAIATLQQLGAYNIEHCEEPIARWNFMQLPLVSRQSPIPIMADESCGDEHDAERLIVLQACAYLNVKLCKTGGLLKALRIARMAETSGIKLQVGAMIESRLGMTAFAHYALCSDAIVHYDFDTALMFSEDPVTGGIIYRSNGVVEVPEAPGIGATVSPERLMRMEQVVC
jgi:L-alanine-DL-glutamate epimerase-like enolase superfamily enzyme